MAKKITAMLLALTLIVTLFAACGGNGDNSSSTAGSSSSGTSSAGGEDSGTAESSSTGENTGDLPTISLMVTCGTTPADTPAIEAALSEITREKIGCNVELITIEIGNASQQMNLLLAGGDDTLDVFYAGIGTSFVNVASQGQAMELDSLLEPYAEEMKKALGENVYESGRINGKLYGVGRLLDQASVPCFTIRADIADEFGYKNGDKIDLEKLTKLFQDIHEKYPDTPIIGPNNGSPNIGDSRVDSLGDGNKLGVLGNAGQDDTVINYYESEYYTELVSYFKKWKEMGVYMPDLLNSTEAPVDFIPTGKCFGCFAGHFSAEMNGIWSTSNFGVDCASLQIYDDTVAVTPGAYGCINPATKNPEMAAGLLHLLSTNADVENLLINGIEGQHYQVLDDGSATYLEGQDITSVGWCLGYSWANQNSTLSIPFDYPADYFDQLLAANAAAKQSKAFGCQFDLTGVSDAVSACTNVVNQYANPLAAGSVEDFDATLKKFQEDLKAAGIDEIIAARQEQLDAFLGK